MVVARSDSYLVTRLILAGFSGLATGWGAWFLYPDFPGWFPLGLIFPGILVGWTLGAFGPVLRLFTPARRLYLEVHERALRAFYENDLTATKDHTGVLIFISLLEHRAVILADKGINAKVEATTWNQILATLLSEIRSGRADAGLITAITSCGEILARHFPAEPGDKNELPNQLVIEL